MAIKLETNMRSLAGKTIKHARFVDSNESVAIAFTDGTGIFMDVRFFGDSHDIELLYNVEDYNLLEAGFYNNEDHEAISDKNELSSIEHSEKVELKRLLDKYGVITS